MLPGENVAYWYMWYRWDPEDKLGVWSSTGNFEIIDWYLHYHLAQQVYWDQYSAWDLTQGERLTDGMQRPLWDPGNADPASYQYMPYGMPSASFPGLINRNAPDNTIITRCTKHRKYTIVRTPVPRGGPPAERGPRRGAAYETTRVESDSPQDVVLRLDGSCALVPGLGYDWATQPPR
jgi:hypothetical protein